MADIDQIIAQGGNPVNFMTAAEIQQNQNALTQQRQAIDTSALENEQRRLVLSQTAALRDSMRDAYAGLYGQGGGQQSATPQGAQPSAPASQDTNAMSPMDGAPANAMTGASAPAPVSSDLAGAPSLANAMTSSGAMGSPAPPSGPTPAEGFAGGPAGALSSPGAPAAGPQAPHIDPYAQSAPAHLAFGMPDPNALAAGLVRRNHGEMIPQVMQAYMQRLKMQSDVAEQQMKIVAGHYDEATNRILSVAGQPEALQMVDEYAQKGFIDPAQATAFKRFLNVGPNATPEQKEQARFAFASYLSGGKDIVDQTLKAQAEKRQGLELQVNALAKDAELRIAQKKLQVEVARLGLDATKLHFIQTPNGTVSTNEYTGGLQIPQVPSITGLGGSVIAQASDPSLIPTGQPAGPSMPAGGAGHGLVPIAKPGQFGQSIENMIASTTPGAQVTRFRSLARNAQLPGSAANSGHTTDNKVDVTPPKGMTLDQLYSAYKNVAYDPVSNPQGLWRIIREKDHLDIGPAPTLATLPSLASIPQMLAATNNPAYTNQFKPGYVPEYTPPHVAQYVPIGGQPSGGQPSGGQPSGGQPSGGQPSGGQPSGGQPAANVIPGTQPTLYTPAQQQAISVQSSLRLARQLYDTIQQSAKAGAIPSATASPLSNFATNLYGIHAYGGMPVGSFLPGANQSLSQREKMSGLAVQLTKALQNIHGPVEKGQSTTGNMQVRTQQEFSTFLSSLGGGAANNTSAEARIQSLNGLLTSLGLPPADRIPPNAVQQRAQQRSQSSNAPAAPTRDGVLHGALVQ